MSEYCFFQDMDQNPYDDEGQNRVNSGLKDIVLKEQIEIDILNNIMKDNCIPYTILEKLKILSLNSNYIGCENKNVKKRDSKTPLFLFKKLLYDNEKEKKKVQNLFDIYDLFPNEDVVIKAIGFFTSKLDGKEYIFIIYNYYPFPDLYDFLIESKRTIPEEQICNITYQILNIMKLLKDRKVIHNDIKLENFIIMQQVPIKIGIIDFDFAEKNKTFSRSNDGTLFYSAPEYFIENKRYFASDMWSLGVNLHIALYDTYPFVFECDPDDFYRIKNVVLTSQIEKPFFVDDDDKAWQCISLMLDKSHITRIKPEEALKLSWFSEFTIFEENDKQQTKSYVMENLKQAGNEDYTLGKTGKDDDDDDNDNKNDKNQDDDDDDDKTLDDDDNDNKNDKKQDDDDDDDIVDTNNFY